MCRSCINEQSHVSPSSEMVDFTKHVQVQYLFVYNAFQEKPYS